MTTLPSSRGLTLNISAVQQIKSRQFLSPKPAQTPSMNHHPGQRVSGTSPEPRIISPQAGEPFMFPVMSAYPMTATPYSAPNRLILSPININSASASLHSAGEEWEEEGEDSQDKLEFRYYLPQESSNSEDCYTEVSWAAFDKRGARERTGTEAMPAVEYELPTVQDDDFNYYPEKSSQASKVSLATGRADTPEKENKSSASSRGKGKSRKKTAHMLSISQLTAKLKKVNFKRRIGATA